MPPANKPVRLNDGSYKLPPFAILDEHEFVDEETGKKQVFDKHRLQRLADKLNRRVQETGDLIPVTLGHTVDGLPEHRQPPIVGLTRNFRLAPLRKSGRWAIWADPISPAEHVETFRKHPRRSVELWAAKSKNGEDDIDPIAILGATSPKRDLGLHQFSRSNGPAIHYLDPTDGRIHYRKETGDDDMPSDNDDTGDTGSKLSPADVKAIVAELLQTEPLKKLLAVAEKMDAGSEAGEPTADDGTGPPGDTGPGGADFGPGAGAEPPEMTEGADRGGDPRREMAGEAGGSGSEDYQAAGSAPIGARSARPMANAYHRTRTPRRQSRTVPEYTGDWRQWLEDYEAMNNQQQQPPDDPIREQVGRQDAELKRYKRENEAMHKRLAALERENVALEINGTLAELAKEFVLDEEEEFKELIRMSKPQRDARYDQIKRRYAKRADELPGSGEFVLGGHEEATLTRMSRRGDAAPVNRYARSGEDASRIASEMARRGITDPEEFYARIQAEQKAAEERNGTPVRTR